MLVSVFDQTMDPHGIFKIDRVRVDSCGCTRQHVDVMPTGGQSLRQIMR